MGSDKRHPRKAHTCILLRCELAKIGPKYFQKLQLDYINQEPMKLEDDY